MKNTEIVAHESYPDTHHDAYSKTVFGFWVYLLTDFVLFATFFATYAVLRTSVYGGPSAREIFNLDGALIQMLVMLVCSFTMGMAGATVHRKKKNATILLMIITFLLGMAFMWMEASDFTRLIQDGNTWKRSAFLSAYYTLIGTYALHMVFALLWTFVLIGALIKESDVDNASIRRVTCLRMFWQFLSIIWSFIFTIVYFMGEY